jgi:hypothetical protein
MSTEQEVTAKIAQVDSFGNQEDRIKGYKELTANVLDAKKFPLFKNIVDHCKHNQSYYLKFIVLREEVPTTVSKPVLLWFAKEKLPKMK